MLPVLGVGAGATDSDHSGRGLILVDEDMCDTPCSARYGFVCWVRDIVVSSAEANAELYSFGSWLLLGRAMERPANTLRG